MAGEMAEAMFDGLPVPDYQALLTRESAHPVFDEFGFEYGSLGGDLQSRDERVRRSPGLRAG
jgi:hypothetical protein